MTELKYKPDFERARQYWDAFWAHDLIDRPCAVVWAKTSDRAEVAPYVQGIENDFNATLLKFEQYLETHVFLGEAMPGIRPNFGPDQMAGFMGAPLHYSQENNTSWSEKIVLNWDAFLPLAIDTQGACWQRMHAYHAAAEAFCKGKCLLYNIDLHSNIDCLEGLRGAQNLLFDIIDQPDAVLLAIDQEGRLWEKIYDDFFRYGDKKTLGSTSLLHLYSRGRYNPIQADFICLLSPEMFRTFVLPSIIHEAQYLDHSCFHLDGVDALKHLDDILAIPEIDAVQWIPGAGQKPQLEWPEVLTRVQKAGKAIILYGTIEQIKAIHNQYDPRLVVYEVYADSVCQGNEFLDWLKRNT